MKKLLTLIAIACSVTCVAQKYNYLLFIMDDVGNTASVPYGCDYSFMPKIDSMAQDGIRFSNFNAHPSCAVSRVSLFTGRDAARQGIGVPLGGNLSTNEYCFVRSFNDDGYHTWVSGKWNMWWAGAGEFATQDENIEFHGFDEHLCFEGPTITYLVDDQLPNTDENFWPYHYEQFTLSQLDSVGSTPFFGVHSFGLAHDPYTVGTPDFPDATDPQSSFTAKMAYMDKIYSNIVGRVESLGLADNTIIGVIGDNGTDAQIQVDYRGQVVFGGKGVYGVGQRVPCFFICPDLVTPNTVYDGLSSFHDLPFTFFDISGYTLPDDRVYDGISFADQLTGVTNRPHKLSAPFGTANTFISQGSNERTYTTTATPMLSRKSDDPYGNVSSTSPSQLDLVSELSLASALNDTAVKQFGDTPYGTSTNYLIMTDTPE